MSDETHITNSKQTNVVWAKFLKNEPQRQTMLYQAFSCVTEKIFFLFLNQNICCGYSKQTCVVGTQKNRLNETVLLSTQNIC